MSDIRIVLPARLASSRLPEKLLRSVGGKTVLRHTYEAASQAKSAAAGVIVAVDHPRLAEEVESFGGQWVMTPQDCPSGTDRIAHVAEQFPEVQSFVNVQSDEPEIEPESIDAVAGALASDREADIATAATPIRDAALLDDPGIVKIAIARKQATISAADADSAVQGRAVYFSRALIPHDRDGDPGARLAEDPPVFWHHLGLYAYRRTFLSWFRETAPSGLEILERLEQLRAIEAGKRITVVRVESAQSGIDTPADLDAFRARMEANR